MKSLFYTFSLLPFILGGVISKEVTYEWNLDAKINNGKSPDCMNVGEERRSMFLAQDSFPGPTIEADEGDTIKVRINNMNPVSTASIHFHGIHQIGTPYSDGASFITQCALGPLQTQEYIFAAYPPGTHYWHDHASYNLADGLSGPIIIRPKVPEPFIYNEEKVCIISFKTYPEAILDMLPSYYDFLMYSMSNRSSKKEKMKYSS